jgi:serine phosphatase RsbU (regulator of sigma subunit)
MEIQVAAAKVSKYAVRESGDTLEMIERPGGGLSFVLADGQGHGRAAKEVSHLVAKKAVTLLADGVRDGAAARATHDFLYSYQQGKVSATLNIVSVDLRTRTVVLSTNSHCPVIVLEPTGTRLLTEPSQPIGIYPGTKPSISELPLVVGTGVVVFTDGILEAGERYGQPLDVPATVAGLLAGEPPSGRLSHPTQALGRGCDNLPSAQSLADGLLAAAMSADRGRPQDDMSILVVAVAPGEEGNRVRRLAVTFPIE